MNVVSWSSVTLTSVAIQGSIVAVWSESSTVAETSLSAQLRR